MAELPRGMPSLEVLLQEARAPGAVRAEVDALLVGLSQPLGPEHSPRERANLLLSIIEDERIRDFTGSDGRTVQRAAVQALMALGYPYALEIPPEALAEEDFSEQSERLHLLATPKGRAGFGIIATVALLLLVPASYVASFANISWLTGVALIGGFTVIPAILTVMGHNSRNKPLKIFGNVWLLVVGLFWLSSATSVFVSGSLSSLIPAAIGAAMLLGGWLLNSKE